MKIPALEAVELPPEAVALQKHFDERNRASLRWFLGVLTTASLFAIGLLALHGFEQPLRLAFYLLNLLAALAFLLVRRETFFARHFRSVLVTYLFLQVAASGLWRLQVDGSILDAGSILPILLVFCRLRLLEDLLLYGTFWVAMVLRSKGPGAGQETFADVALIIVTLLTAFCLATAVSLTQVEKRRFLAIWRREQSTARERLRLREEVEVARRIQVSMLPQAPPDVAWMELAAVSLPASEVGGDYYDYFRLSASRLALVIGDVAGHGMASGLVLSGVRSCLYLLDEELASPVAVLERLNRMVRRTTERRTYVTLLSAVVDRDLGTLAVATAGHPPLVHYRHAERRCVEVGHGAPPLGTFLGVTYTEESCRLAPNDLLVLYTDGLSEARSSRGIEYGPERLQRVVARVAGEGRPVREIRDAVLSDLANFKGNEEQADAAPPKIEGTEPGPPGEGVEKEVVAAAARPGRAGHVAAGILASRIFGLLREQTVAFFFGLGPHADALTAALRVPNAIQNLLGEGALSAAFIPIYSRLLEEGREEEAGRFAGAILGLLAATAAGLALAGVLLAKPLVAFIASGYLADAAAVAAGRASVDRFALSVSAVRILFPMTGLIVLSVWALGILNSHRRFFLAYVAPVVWNSTMIAALLLVGSREVRAAGAHQGVLHLGLPALDRLLQAFCWGGLLGGLLQFLVQLPLVLRLSRGIRLSFSTRVPFVRQALAAWGPVVMGRGVVQLAGYLDLYLASWLVTGATSADSRAQTLYLLPISLFGMSISASELPELSRLQGEGNAAPLLARVFRALRSVLFLNVPTVVGYLAFGYLIVGALFRHGRFGVPQNWLVYLILCGYSLGILATTSSRLLQNTFYALGDSKTPARIATQRVMTSALVAVPLMLWLDRFPISTLVRQELAGSPLYAGALGLSSASAVGAWTELWRLQGRLRHRLPDFHLPLREELLLIVLATASTLPAAALWWLLPPLPVALTALLVVGLYGMTYLAASHLTGRAELSLLLGRFGGKGGRGGGKGGRR